MSGCSLRPKIVVFAYSEVGAACLEALLRCGADIAAVFTHEDDPCENIWFRSVAAISESNGLLTLTLPAACSEAVSQIQALAPEYIFSFYYRHMIPQEVLDASKRAFNLHGSLLPQLRGRACVNWAVINGETRTGATLHVMTDKPDRGDIVAQKSVDIFFQDTAHTIFMKVARAGAEIIEEAFPAIISEKAVYIPQDESKATYFSKRTPADGQIYWSSPPITVYNLIRGVTHPFPGAYTHRGREKIYIWSACPRDGLGKSDGEILSLSPLLVSAGGGVLEILTLQPENGVEQTGAHYALKKLRVGERLDGCS